MNMKKSEDRVLDKKTKNRMLRSMDIDKNDIPKVVNEYFSYINFDNHLKGTQELKTIIVHCYRYIQTKSDLSGDQG